MKRFPSAVAARPASPLLPAALASLLLLLPLLGGGQALDLALANSLAIDPPSPTNAAGSVHYATMPAGPLAGIAPNNDSAFQAE